MLICTTWRHLTETYYDQPQVNNVDNLFIMQYSAGSGIKLMLTPLQTKYTPSGQLRSATPQHLLRNGSENMTKKMLIPIRLSMSVTC